MHPGLPMGLPASQPDRTVVIVTGMNPQPGTEVIKLLLTMKAEAQAIIFMMNCNHFDTGDQA